MWHNSYYPSNFCLVRNNDEQKMMIEGKCSAGVYVSFNKWWIWLSFISLHYHLFIIIFILARVLNLYYIFYNHYRGILIFILIDNKIIIYLFDFYVYSVHTCTIRWFFLLRRFLFSSIGLLTHFSHILPVVQFIILSTIDWEDFQKKKKLFELFLLLQYSLTWIHTNYVGILFVCLYIKI